MMGRIGLRQKCVADDGCLAAEAERAREIEAITSGARTRNENNRTCETCISYNGMKSEYSVNCLAHFAKPTKGIELAVDCDSYQPAHKNTEAMK